MNKIVSKENKYKICILLDELYKFGGGEMFLEDLLNNSSKKLDFKYLFVLNETQNTYHEISKMPIKKLNFNKKNIDKACKECDVLIFWGRVLDSIRNFKIKKIMWAHSQFSVNYFLEKAEEYTDHFVACSTHVKNSINKKKCTIIYPGIDTSRYELPNFKLKKSLGFTDEDFVIGLFCRFVDVKDIPFLIKSLSLIEDFTIKLLLIGHGPQQDSILKLCEKKIPKRFQYLYYSNTKNIYSYYKCLDAFCLTSKGEGYSRCQWESNFFKIPFITKDIGGARDGVIDGKNGFIIKKEEDLKEIVENLKKDKKLTNRIKENAYKFFIENGKIENTISKIEKLLDDLFSKKYHKIY